MKKDRSAGVLQPGRAPHGRRSDGRARGGALAAALALGASGGLQAADTTPSAADGGGTVARADVGAAPLGTGLLSPVLVTATRSPAELLGVPASASVVTRGELDLRSTVRLGDAIADVPGVYLRGAAFGAAYPGSGQAVLSMRGIPRTPRTLVMIDGQPLNNALSGGINVAGIAFDTIERVEIVRGPYSALYGGSAMGGVINFISATPDKPLTEVRAGLGSLQQRGLSLVHRQRWASGFGLSLALGHRESAGDPNAEEVVKQPATGAPGTPVTGALATTTAAGAPAWTIGVKGPRPWQQQHAQLTLHQELSPATRVAAGFSWAEYRIGYARPQTLLRNASGAEVFSGVLGVDGGATRLNVAQSDFLTATPSSERDLRFFVRADHRFSGGARLHASLATLRHQFDFAQATSGVSTYDAGSGDFVRQPNNRTDFDVSLHLPMRSDWMLVAGAAANRSSMDRRTVALSYWRDDGTETTTLNAGKGSANNQAVFIQSEHMLAEGVTAYLGGRYDRYQTEGEVSQNTSPAFTQAYAKREFSRFSPKLALVWEARPGLSLRASYGAGFRPPALLDLYSRTAVPGATAGTVSVNEASPDLKPEQVQALEFGADARLPGSVALSATVYSQRLKDLIYRRRLSQVLTRTENAGGANVDGIEASVRWPFGRTGMRGFASFTHQFRYEITSNDAVPASVGKNLTDVPRTIWSVGLQYDAQPWSGQLVYRHVSQVFGSGDDLNQNTAQGVFGAYDAHGIASARVVWRYDRHLSLSLAVDNLANQRYYVFNRQPGRTMYGEVAWRF
jgi:iron complex outermembrane receptor protein